MMKYELFSVQDFAKHDVKIFHEVSQWRKKVKAKYREQSVNSASVSTTESDVVLEWKMESTNRKPINYIQFFTAKHNYTTTVKLHLVAFDLRTNLLWVRPLVYQLS